MPKMVVYAGQGYEVTTRVKGGVTVKASKVAQVGDRLAVPQYGVVIARVPNDGSTRQQRRAAARG